MATVPFPGSWTPDAQFTGNSDFVFDSGGVIWLVANSTASGAIIFKSSDNGGTFQQAATISSVGSVGLSFDPAIAIDASDVLHIVGQVLVDGAVKLQKFSYDTVGNTLTGPFTLETGGIIGSDYDIVPLSNGNCYVVAGLVTLSTETVEGYEVDGSGSIVSTDSIVNQALGAGNRYGSVSLLTPDGVSVEIYLCSIAKAFTFSDAQAQITVSVRNGSDTIAAPTTLTTFNARYVTDRLTVIANGNARYLCQAYFTQQAASMISNALVGHLATSGGTWSFNSFLGTASRSLHEPVLSVSSTGVVLAVINANLANFAAGATISIFDLNTTGWVLTPRSDFPYPGLANWLRGSKMLIPSVITWCMLAQRAADGVGRFYTGATIPPTPNIAPSTATGTRGVAAVFDASGSFDLNLLALQFTWSLTDSTGTAALIPNGAKASVILPLSAGPAAVTLTVTVSVQAVDAGGNDVGSPVTASATLNYPEIPAPIIATPTPINAARNAQVTITPSVTVSAYTTPEFLWAQTGGTSVEMLSLATSENLLIQTNGAAIGGETLSFTLTVDDGINSPVEAVFDVIVPARAATGETRLLNRAQRGGNVSQRNSALTWGAPSASSTLTEFTRVKRAPVFVVSNGVPEFIQGGAYTLIGPLSVTIERNGETWHALTPVFSETILDAAHGFLDQTIVLTSTQKLLQMIPASPATDTDYAQETILLNDISTATYTTVDVTPSFNGSRIITLTGTEGVLLLEVDNMFRVIATLALGGGAENLYGSSNVQWVRLVDVENLSTGSLLVGTLDTSTGSTYETEFDLATRSVVSTFDSTGLRNQHVSTGELLFESVDSYSGIPLPPVISSVTNGSAGITVVWTQVRPDLVSGFIVTVSTGGAAIGTYIIGSGSITSATIPALQAGATYSFQIVATSADGNSAPSNVFDLTL